MCAIVTKPPKLPRCRHPCNTSPRLAKHRSGKVSEIANLGSKLFVVNESIVTHYLLYESHEDVM